MAYVDEDTINAVVEQLCEDDSEFAAILTTYSEARGALAKARIARGVYPVVVPADVGPQARFGRNDQAQATLDLRPKLERTPNLLAREKSNREVKDPNKD